MPPETTTITPRRESAAYSATVDSLNQCEWEKLLSQFADASIYQSWAYGAAHWGSRHLSRVVLWNHHRPVALAQARLIRLPAIPGGIAYISKGPAWCLAGREPEMEDLRQMLSALRAEYSVRRGLFLKVVPNVLAEGDHPVKHEFLKLGFGWKPGQYRTLLVDLSLPLEQLRSGLRQSWRKALNKAEKRGIELIEGTGIELIDEAVRIHHEMHDRKGYAEFVNMDEFRAMHQELPDDQKLRVVLCKFEGEIVSALAWSVLGDTGLPLIGATRRKALEIDASYVMFWRMLQWMKENGYRYCDLAGINPERNPGSYTFKSGLAKRNGLEVASIGEFHHCEALLSRMAHDGADLMKRLVRDAKLWAERFTQSRRESAPPPPGNEE